MLSKLASTMLKECGCYPKKRKICNRRLSFWTMKVPENLFEITENIRNPINYRSSFSKKRIRKLKFRITKTRKDNFNLLFCILLYWVVCNFLVYSAYQSGKTFAIAAYHFAIFNSENNFRSYRMILIPNQQPHKLSLAFTMLA